MTSWAQKTGKTGTESRPGTSGSTTGILVVEDNPDEAGLVQGRVSVNRPSSQKQLAVPEKSASPKNPQDASDQSESRTLAVKDPNTRPSSQVSNRSDTRGRVSFAALNLAANGGDKEQLTKNDVNEEEDEAAKEERRKKRLKRKEKFNFFMKWAKLTLYLLLLVGVVSLCVISAILSFIKFIKTNGQPASTYKPLKNPGPHDIPGIIFIGVGLNLHSCGVLNFTSLDIDSLPQNDICDTLTFDLSPSDSLSKSVEESLPDFLKNEKAQEQTVSVFLFRGPGLWENKETTSIHFLIPNTHAGIWAVIHQKHEEAYGMFESAIAGDADEKWTLAAQVVIEFSLTFVAANYRSFFMMRKQEFKKSGTIETTRIDMEISLVEFNQTQFQSLNPSVVPTNYKSHVEALFQWKDGYYMEGDSFLATSPFQIVTVISSALLMFDRAYNTFMRLVAQAKKKPKPVKLDEDEKKEEKNDEPQEQEDGKRSVFDNPFAEEIMESDQEFQDGDFRGGQQPQVQNQNPNDGHDDFD